MTDDANRLPAGSPPASAPGTGLLPADALRGLRIGISTSDSADLARLGLTPSHFQLAVRELARTVLLGGGTLAYGGNLRPGGYTEFLITELGAYASVGVFDEAGRQQDAALRVCLSMPEHRRRSLDELQQASDALGLHGELCCLDADGRLLPDRSADRGADAAPAITDPAVLAHSLTAMRHYMTAQTATRLLIGGKLHGYTGAMPGLMEEALLALQAGQPLFLAAGFGGATLALASAVDPQCASLLPPYDPAAATQAGTAEALDAVRQLVADAGWRRLDNGLDDDENRHLAATHRPAEIAALVGLGLARWAERRRGRGAATHGAATVNAAPVPLAARRRTAPPRPAASSARRKPKG